MDNLIDLFTKREEKYTCKHYDNIKNVFESKIPIISCNKYDCSSIEINSIIEFLNTYNLQYNRIDKTKFIDFLKTNTQNVEFLIHNIDTKKYTKISFDDMLKYEKNENTELLYTYYSTICSMDEINICHELTPTLLYMYNYFSFHKNIKSAKY